MCGIVGYIGTQTATDILLDGLRKLEYRGYDSAGIATLWEGEIQCIRAKGKLYNLQTRLQDHSSPAQIGIGHTRWATHGKPEERNAHPHLNREKGVAVVQNGIIENHRDLRDRLSALGYPFESDTDTETIPHLIAHHLTAIAAETAQPFSPLLEAVSRAIQELEGAFAIAVICAAYPDELIIARQQAPLCIGFGQGEFFCASDTTAIANHTQTVLSLENGEIAKLTPLGVEVYNFQGERLRKQPRTLDWNPSQVEKQGFRHFMLKEIHEQPEVMRACLGAYFNGQWLEKATQNQEIQNQDTQNPLSPVQLRFSDDLYSDLQQVQIVACGTSWHASLVGKYLLEQVAGIPTTVHYASEFRYAPTPLMPHTLTIGVTQSGETADTLAALEMEQERRNHHQGSPQGGDYRPRLLGITNRPESTLAHVLPNVILTPAGVEVGVAATKTFMAQLMAFYALALDLAHHRHHLPSDRLRALVSALHQLPNQMEALLRDQEEPIATLAHEFVDTHDFIFLGRGINFPIALEGALKLKEISYIHAEGYPAGEMKHGPIALLDAKVPVVAIAVPGAVYEKVLSNAQEAKARDARIIGVSTIGREADMFDDLLAVPPVDELVSPLLTVIPLQLLSYYIAALRGLDVDQPRNLAKSVTVE
ncbi:glutamine--fructose-6-phosphate transaminase (isomerizing) [Prochlorothrix hollandica]|uniref:glutamine--fructose-6-phosphate transaminase (isomerizing) n=1 Tax=Prochlorothrix hollandica TaxID=1223 RepID=UPI00333EC68C